MYQTIWIRKLAFVFGNTTLSVSLVISSFFFGLSIGGLVLGRRVDRVRRPLHFYAWLELGIALSAFVVLCTLDRLDLFYVYLYRNVFARNLLAVNIAKPVLSFLLLFLPAFLMGGTLPALAKSYARSEEEFGGSLGRVYAVNTAGAFAGLMAMSFVIIELLGLSRSYALTLLISALAAACAFAASTGAGAPAAVHEHPAPAASAGRRHRALLAVGFALGAIGMGYEVLWIRLWSYISLHSSVTPVGMAPAEMSSTYVYSSILGVLLLGISAGGALVKRFQPSARPQRLARLALVQLLIGLLTLATLILERRAALDGVALKFIEMAVIVFPVAVLMGIGFPLLASLCVDSISASGRQFGGYYAANTLGSSLGPLVVGMVILPALGTYSALMLLAALNLLIALGLAIAAGEPVEGGLALRRRILSGAAAAGLLLAVLLVQPPPIRTITTAKKVIYEDDNDVAHTILLQLPGGDKQLVMNNYSVSGITALNEFGRQMMQIPVAFLGRVPEDILVVCVGAGSSWRATLKYPDASVVAVDINPSVFECMPLIHPPEVHAGLKGPRMAAVVADGRNYLLLDDGTYDIINIDPSPPISQPGMVNLHTLEFYQLVKARLKPDGVLYQRFSGNVPSEFIYRALLRPVRDVFKHVTVWDLMHSGLDIIASDRELNVLHNDPRLIDPDVVRRLDRLFLAGRDEVEAYVKDVAPVTDDRPVLEYYLLRKAGLLPSTDPWRGAAYSRDAILALRQPLKEYVDVVTPGAAPKPID